MSPPGSQRVWVLALAALLACAAARAARARTRRRVMLARGELRRLDERQWTIAGRRVIARVAGHPASGAPPVVLVHGLGVSSSYFLPAAERLATRFTVYAPDLPGHGHSEAPAVPLDVRGLADALAQWMQAARIERASIVGHSMGCQVAADFALRHPDRVARLILIGPTLAPSLRNLLRIAPRFLAGGAFERPALLLHIAKDYLRMGWRVVPEAQSLMRDPIERKLARISVPVMLVCGQRDTLVPQSWLTDAAALARAQDVAVIPGWGHAVQFSAPQQVVQAITPFLAMPEDTDLEMDRARAGTSEANARSNAP